MRTETGYQNRDQYKIAVLYQPDKAWEAWAPQKQFNHKLLITHGASCGIDHQAGEAPGVTDGNGGTALGLGFAVMSTALDNAGHNCNIATQAESLIMAKERLVERYGTLRYTIGTGCSGGSLTQQQVSNAYPGIYQGILPQCSFPDSWSTGQQLAAYNLIRRYVEDPTKWAPGVLWDPASIAAVEGHPNHVNSVVFDSVYWTSLGVPDDGCPGVPDDQVYNAQSNPGGVRCALADYMINVVGPRPESVWSPQERALGRGFGAVPLDDVGVQFGLQALEKGQITPAQFADLNAKIGGVDVDINHTDARFEAVPSALRNAYRSGGINTTNNQAGLPIIDLRGPDPGAFHDAYRSWAIRARLEREQGALPAQSRDLVRRDAADRRPALDGRGPRRHGPLARRRRGRPQRSLAAGEGGREPPAGPRRPLLERRRRRAGRRARRRQGLRARRRPDEVRHARDRRRREHRDRHEQVRPAAAPAQRPLPEVVHRRPVGRAREGVPDRRLRLVQARRRAAGDDPVADLPGRLGVGRLRRAAARRRAQALRRRLVERRLRGLEGRPDRRSDARAASAGEAVAAP